MLNEGANGLRRAIAADRWAAPPETLAIAQTTLALLRHRMSSFLVCTMDRQYRERSSALLEIGLRL